MKIMKINNREMPLFRYIIYLTATVGLLCGLTFLVSSCEKEVAGNGKKVAVYLSIGDEGYVNDALRSHAAEKPEESIVFLNDNVYLSLTLEKDTADQYSDALRAGTPGQALDPGQKIRVAAYRNDAGTLESAVNYWNNNGTLVADPAGTQMLVEEGVSYTFAAYSYKSSTVYPPAGNTLNNVSSTDYDLLWNSVSKSLSSTNLAVSINMKHQFAQVKVVVAATPAGGVTSASITNIGSVSISSGNLCSLDVKTGTLSAGTPATQSITSWVNTSGASVESAERRIYPVLSAANTTTVTINNLQATANGSSVTVPAAIPVAFEQVLAAGEKYTLSIALKFTNCGVGGVAKSVRIGNNDYLTHWYGTGEWMRCLMVENSKEGTPTATAYGQMIDVDSYIDGTDPGAAGNGFYYYSRANAASACPTGWHLPTKYELERSLIAEFAGEWASDDRTDGKPAIGKWWNG
jgi:hypothetical protein